MIISYECLCLFITWHSSSCCITAYYFIISWIVALSQLPFILLCTSIRCTTRETCQNILLKVI